VRPGSIDFLITSPPYLNNYHYIRNTRPQLFWLGLVQRRAQLKDMEHASFGKFWQTVRSGPSIDLQFDCAELTELLEELRHRSPHRGVYGGAGWANYAAAYFNDCHAFCRAAHGLMKPRGSAVVVIGNNILQGIEFKTDEYFAQIAQRCGFELVQLHRVRKKRTGSSIVNSSVRSGSPSLPVELYETAIELAAR
jgi:DNA modification methylase